jgi:hypothetical protein
MTLTADDLQSLTTDELWNLYREVEEQLEMKLLAHRTELEDRLRRLGVYEEPLSGTNTLWTPWRN